MDFLKMTEHAMHNSTPTQSFPHNRQEMIEKLRTIPQEIKHSHTPGFIKDPYFRGEIRTCPSWARKNLCRYGSKCVKAHYYFPTIVWRAHRIAQQTSECREWKEQQDIIQQMELEETFEEVCSVESQDFLQATTVQDTGVKHRHATMTSPLSFPDAASQMKCAVMPMRSEIPRLLEIGWN